MTELTDTWRGRVDFGSSALRWHQVVRPMSMSRQPGIAIIGFACDAGVRRNSGRVGAAEGPDALRKQLANLAWHPRAGRELYEAGDVRCRGDELEAAHGQLAEKIRESLLAGHFPLVLGGGHELAWASYRGIEEFIAVVHRGATLGIVNFDAHFDMRVAAGERGANSGTPFYQIWQHLRQRGDPFKYLCLGVNAHANTDALYETARTAGAEWIEDRELIWPQYANACARLKAFVDSVDLIYLSVCLDVFPAAAAPGVSAPAARGVDVNLAFALLEHLLELTQHGSARGRLVLADIAELNPAHDQDERTARLAARIAAEVCAPLV
jgi:formiminoglutamase